MSKKILYNTDDYKDYLIAHPSVVGRGGPSRLARALKCQPAYIHKIFHSEQNLSLEQADRVNSFLAHSPQDGHFFMLLVQVARAGTISLKQYFLQQIRACRLEQNKLSRGVDAKTLKKLDETAEARYYSDWYYAATLMALTIPPLNTVSSVSRALGRSPEFIARTMEDLIKMGLVRQTSDLTYQALRSSLYLDEASPHLGKHHLNCRGRMIEILLTKSQWSESNALNFSSIVTLSHADVLHIREELLTMIENFRKRIRPSPEETMQMLTIDFQPCFSLEFSP